MYDSILVPLDGSDAADAAFGHALDIAADHGAAVYTLNVANTNKPSLVRIGDDVVDTLEREGEKVIADARGRAEDRGIEFSGEVQQGDPGEMILEGADEYDADLIAMGTRGLGGVRRYILGSVAEHVVRRADVPVLTVRSDDGARTQYPYERILVPTDGSDHAEAALGRALELAARHGATIHVLSVVDVMAIGVDVRADLLIDQLESRAEESVRRVAEKAESRGVNAVTDVTIGSVYREIRAYAEREAVDLLVMGTHGRRGVDRYLMGSVAERVVRTAPSPVLTVRAESADGT